MGSVRTIEEVVFCMNELVNRLPTAILRRSAR